MVVIYAEKSSLAKEIAAALHSGNRIAHPKDPTIGHYEFIFKGEKAVLCHGVGQRRASAPNFVLERNTVTTVHFFQIVNRDRQLAGADLPMRKHTENSLQNGI